MCSKAQAKRTRVNIETESRPLVIEDMDLFRAYRNAVAVHGLQHAFLLESLQGPDQDCRQSVLGLHCLAEIVFSRSELRIQGCQAVCGPLQAVAAQALGLAPAPLLQLRSAQDHWVALRALLWAYGPEPDATRFGYFAFIGYDTGRLIESIPARLVAGERPLITLGLFQAHVVVPRSGQASLSIRQFPGVPPLQFDSVLALLAGSAAAGGEPACPAPKVHFTMGRRDYMEAATQALEHIRAGDIYQVQLGHEIQVRSAMAPAALYARLRLENPSPYMFLCHVGGVDMIGASPESYVQLADTCIAMRPIAGTVAKGLGLDRQAQIARLVESAKENAEHVMLVDLCRNDIGRVCSDGSLQVPELMGVGEFPNLFHLISTVTGRLRPGKDVVDLIRATFPAGTMVGAPKVRAMEIIEALELSCRGGYAGGIGLLGFGNFANLALCIRMATRDDDTYRLRASAGIVVDSNPLSEWNETLVKMSRIYKALTGEELVA